MLTAIAGRVVNHFNEYPYHVYMRPFDVRLASKELPDKDVRTVAQPDVCVICDLDKLDKWGCVGAPDLVVEILSLGSTKKEMHQKIEAYETSDFKEYCLELPEEKFVLKYVLNAEGIFIGYRPVTEDEIFTSTIFPDLSLSLLDVFKNI